MDSSVLIILKLLECYFQVKNQPHEKKTLKPEQFSVFKKKQIDLTKHMVT